VELYTKLIAPVVMSIA